MARAVDRLLLTEPDDIVLDPFAGSNTTGRAAETLGRRWIALEKLADYVEGGRARFEQDYTFEDPVESKGRQPNLF